MKHKLAFTTALVTMALMGGTQAQAETVTTHTVTQTQDIPGAQRIDFMAFDTNGDGILSRSEVGEKLYRVFDHDGNQVIDNIEFDTPTVLTLVPMEQETISMIDLNDDGVADRSTYSYQEFLDQSRLARFDQDADGLSPRDFIGHSFLELDTNNDKTISLIEWKRAYTDLQRPMVAEQSLYNR